MKKINPSKAGVLLTRAIEANDVKMLEKVFLVAFCGPYLTDAQRLFALKWVDGKISSSGFQPEKDSLAEDLRDWKIKQKSDDEIVEIIFQKWDAIRAEVYA